MSAGPTTPPPPPPPPPPFSSGPRVRSQAYMTDMAWLALPVGGPSRCLASSCCCAAHRALWAKAVGSCKSSSRTPLQKSLHLQDNLSHRSHGLPSFLAWHQRHQRLGVLAPCMTASTWLHAHNSCQKEQRRTRYGLNRVTWVKMVTPCVQLYLTARDRVTRSFCSTACENSTCLARSHR